MKHELFRHSAPVFFIFLFQCENCHTEVKSKLYQDGSFIIYTSMSVIMHFIQRLISCNSQAIHCSSFWNIIFSHFPSGLLGTFHTDSDAVNYQKRTLLLSAPCGPKSCLGIVLNLLRLQTKNPFYKHLQFLMNENQTLKASELEPIYIVAY
jgi:hypothetical protein